MKIAPRFSEQIKYVEKLQMLSDALSQHLRSVDEFTRVDLQANNLEMDLMLQYAGATTLCAATTLQDLEGRRQRQRRSLVDRGGNTNVYKELEGPPAWRLVTDLLHIYEQLSPQPAQATECGDFYDFAFEIFEYATGEPECRALEFWIKKLVKPTREQNALRLEIEALSNELEELSKADGEANLKRAVEISKAIIDRQNRELALAEITWPHFRPLSLKHG